MNNQASFEHDHPETAGLGAYRPRFCEVHYARWLQAGGNARGWAALTFVSSRLGCDVTDCRAAAKFQEHRLMMIVQPVTGGEHEADRQPA